MGSSCLVMIFAKVSAFCILQSSLLMMTDHARGNVPAYFSWCLPGVWQLPSPVTLTKSCITPCSMSHPTAHDRCRDTDAGGCFSCSIHPLSLHVIA